MTIAYFDCFNGAAGDMIVGALLDAGLSADELEDMLHTLPIGGYELSFEKVDRLGLAAMRFEVRLDPAESQPPRGLGQIRELISGTELSDAVQHHAVAVFETLAEAEAQVHGSPVEHVHFHEVGAVDAVVDIVSACWAMEKLGIDRVVCSPIPVGSGTVTCAHGLLPVPAPATAILLKGVPIVSTGQTGELTTPTGAAVLTHWADTYGPMPAMRIEEVGIGAGAREDTERPNILRVMIGSPADQPSGDQIVVLEANLDDTTGEVVGHALERLLNAGALDAYTLPIHMKKSRPGVLVTVLAEPDRAAELESILFSETTTFGIRRHEASRSRLERRFEAVETPFGSIRVKVGRRGDQVMTASPEFDDCRAAAEQSGVPVRDVMAAASEAWRCQQVPRRP